MSEYFDRARGGDVSDFAKRMRHFIRILSRRASTVAGLSISADEEIESLDFIVDQPDDGLRAMGWESWEPQQRIEKRVSWILDIEERARINAYVDRVAS